MARAQTVVWLTIGIGLLALSGAALYFSSRNDALTAYNSAPACARIADAAAGENCRYTDEFMVTAVSGYNNIQEVDLAFPGQYAVFSFARLPFDTTPPQVGDVVRVELWRLKVTRLGAVPTLDNPANDPRPRTLVVIALILLPLGLGATAWGVVAARRPATAAADMSPVAMSDVLWR